MGRYKYLIKNIGLLTLSSFATKLLSFFLVPLYTNILTTAEYGTYDFFNTTVGIMLPILTLNIQEAVIRFCLDKKYKRDSIVTVSVRYLLISIGITAVGILTNYIFGFSQLVKDYAVFFFLMFLTHALSGIVLYYTRGVDQISDLSISSVIASVVTIGLNILFLVVFRWGLYGYFLANIIGPFVQCLYLIARTHMVRELHLGNRYENETKEMLSYSKPMIANSIGWWINNASDRYVVIFFCGIAENGVYSVASKIPTILNIFQNIFNQAWVLSAVKDYDPEDKNGFFANTYRVYNCAMTLICSAIIVCDKILARFLYAKDFYVAWQYVPWLTVAILFGAISGYLGGFFSAVKNSKIFAQSTMVGAGTNVVLNMILTPHMGPLGAAIATAICYFVVYIIRYVHSKKYITLRITIVRDLISYALIICQCVVLLLISNNTVLYPVLAGLFALIFMLYISDIRLLIRKVLNRS